jgi:MFS family permease
LWPITYVLSPSNVQPSASTKNISAKLPIYFQAVRGQTTVGSGLWYLPTAVSFAVAVLLAGPATSLFGYYNPVMIFGSILMVVGVALITTFTPDTTTGKWIGYQILYGSGCGLAFQQPYTAVQIILAESKVPTALVTLSFAQGIGGIVALSVSQNVLVNRLVHNVAKNVPGLDIKYLLNNGILGIIDAAPVEVRPAVIDGYNAALVDVFYIALGLVCLALTLSLCCEWKSVKDDKKSE